MRIEDYKDITGNLSSIKDVNVGKMKNASKELTLKDIVEFRANTSSSGRMWSSIKLMSEGKGVVTNQSIKDMIHNLPTDKADTIFQHYNEFIKLVEGNSLNKLNDSIRNNQFQAGEEHSIKVDKLVARFEAKVGDIFRTSFDAKAKEIEGLREKPIDQIMENDKFKDKLKEFLLKEKKGGDDSLDVNFEQIGADGSIKDREKLFKAPDAEGVLVSIFVDFLKGDIQDKKIEVEKGKEFDKAVEELKTGGKSFDTMISSDALKPELQNFLSALKKDPNSVGILDVTKINDKGEILDRKNLFADSDHEELFVQLFLDHLEIKEQEPDVLNYLTYLKIQLGDLSDDELSNLGEFVDIQQLEQSEKPALNMIIDEAKFKMAFADFKAEEMEDGFIPQADMKTVLEPAVKKENEIEEMSPKELRVWIGNSNNLAKINTLIDDHADNISSGPRIIQDLLMNVAEGNNKAGSDKANLKAQLRDETLGTLLDSFEARKNGGFIDPENDTLSYTLLPLIQKALNEHVTEILNSKDKNKIALVQELFVAAKNQ